MAADFCIVKAAEMAIYNRRRRRSAANKAKDEVKGRKKKGKWVLQVEAFARIKNEKAIIST